MRSTGYYRLVGALLVALGVGFLTLMFGAPPMAVLVAVFQVLALAVTILVLFAGMMLMLTGGQ